MKNKLESVYPIQKTYKYQKEAARDLDTNTIMGAFVGKYSMYVRTKVQFNKMYNCCRYCTSWRYSFVMYVRM